MSQNSIPARAMKSLCTSYEESLGETITKAYRNGYSLKRYSMLFLALFRMSSHPTGVYFQEGCSYQSFLDLVLYFRSQLVTVPRDYTNWYDKEETAIVDSVVAIVTTTSVPELVNALQEPIHGVELSASKEIFRNDDLELMGWICAKERNLVARWRIGNELNI